MNYVVGLVLLVLAFTMVIAGGQGHGASLFQTVTGKPAGSSGQPKLLAASSPADSATAAALANGGQTTQAVWA